MNEFCPEQPILLVYINNRDRLTCLLSLIKWLEQLPYIQIVILDNDSTYKPLLDWYAKCKYEILYLGKNHGHTALWSENKFSRNGKQIQFQKPGDWYVYTDPDIIPREDCPLDAIQRFREIMLRYPDQYKVGFGLEIKEIPIDHPLYSKIMDHEDILEGSEMCQSSSIYSGY